MSVKIGEPCTVYVFHRSPMSALELRIRGEYREMPGMRLKLEQAMRLWSLETRHLPTGVGRPGSRGIPAARRHRPLRAGTQRLLTALENVMRKITGLITAIAVVGLAGCATMNVSSHIERGTNFTEVRDVRLGSARQPAGR